MTTDGTRRLNWACGDWIAPGWINSDIKNVPGADFSCDIRDGLPLADDSLDWPAGHTVCVDLGLRHRRGDPFIVSDLDEAGWIERFSAPDPSLAPGGEELVQAQMPVRPSESSEAAALRLDRLLDVSLAARQERETWRRQQVMDGRSGPLDYPGRSWRDRPAIDRGDGVFLAGDMVAAPGLLSEVAWASGVEAAKLAVAITAPLRLPALSG